MDSPNFQFQTETEYKNGDKGTGAWAIKPGPEEIPAVPDTPGSVVVSEDFEGTLWQEITFDNGDWIVTSAFAHSGTKSFTNADIGDNQTSEFTIQNDVFDEQVSFWLKTDTEAGFDKFQVLIDNVLVYEESGNNDWHRVAIPTDFGFFITFRYVKDFSASTGTDACYVDDIVIGTLDIPGNPGIPARPFVYTPLKMTDDGECLKVSLCDTTVAVTGTVNTRFLACETDSVSVCIDEPLEVAYIGGTLNNGVQTSVSSVAIQIVEANVNRKKLIIQNVGNANIRVGTTGVSATTGIRLSPNGVAIFDMPDCPTNAIFAIREGLFNSTVLVQQVV